MRCRATTLDSITESDHRCMPELLGTEREIEREREREGERERMREREREREREGEIGGERGSGWKRKLKGSEGRE